MATVKSRRQNTFTITFLVAFLVTQTKPVQLPGDDPKHTVSKGNSLNVCFKPDKTGSSSELVTCFGQQVLRKLQDLEEREEFPLTDGVVMERDESGPRDISNFLDRDPRDFRTIVEGASTLMSRRAMKWDMGFLYPGLHLRIGPTLTENGVLEFVMDPRVRDRENFDNDVSSARLLKRHLLVPFLLGFKFQLSTLLPLLFGLIALLSKKALILSKIAVVAASVFGFNSLFGAGGLGGSHGYGYYGNTGISAYGNRYVGNDYLYKEGGYRSQNLDDQEDQYYGSTTNHHNQDQSISLDEVYKSGPAQSPEDLRDRLERLFAAKHKDRNGNRNFAWNT